MTTDFAKTFDFAQQADDAMQAELVRLFGKDACNRRYDANRVGWDAMAKAAAAIKHIADAKMHRFWEDTRNIEKIERAACLAGQE